MKSIYLDYAATTPVDKEVLEAMTPYFSEKIGNPSSLHWIGQEASGAVFNARKTIADAIGANYKEIVFTGSATEANNLALRGIFNFQKQKKPKIITTAIEHSSILKTCKDLEKQGVEVVYLPVDKMGFVDLKALKRELNERTILVSINYANGEIGTIQDIKKIASVIASPQAKQSPYPLFHTDVVQAFQFLKCDVNELGVDLMTLSAHKIYGPKGVGALYMRNSSDNWLTSIITGGNQEWGLRAGTENVPAIVGFGKAVELVEKNRAKEVKKQAILRDYLWSGIKKIVPEARLNGSKFNLTKLNFVRLPNNLNIYFPNKTSQELVVELDLLGVSVSPGVACNARTVQFSPAIKALGHKIDRSQSSLRFSLGRITTKSEINKVLVAFKKLTK